jgi:proteasome lid subunit RPN8/RPN11
MTREPPRPPGNVLIRLRRAGGDTEYEIGQMALVVRRALGDKVPDDADSDIALSFLRRRSPKPPRESRMINGRAEFGRVAVTVSTADQVTHSHEYAVQELFAPTLRWFANALDDGKAAWIFEIGHPDDETPVVFRSRRRRPGSAARSVSGPVFTVHRGDGAAGSGSAGGDQPDDDNQDPSKLEIELDIDDLDIDSLDDAYQSHDSHPGPLEYQRRMLLVLRMDMDTLADSIADTVHALQAENLSALRAEPPTAGSVEVNPDQPRSMPFSIRKAAEPEPPLLDPGQYRMDTARLGRVNVLLPRDVIELLQTLELSGQVEEGGFLAGQVFRADQAGKHQFVRISRILPAKHSRASCLHFTFTSDSYQAMSQQLATQAEERLVGWWHTHPHGVDAVMGLSTTDVNLHQSTFRQPWQVAGLINLRGRRRMIRFYAAERKNMEECPLWIPDERDGYRHAGTRLGDC